MITSVRRPAPEDLLLELFVHLVGKVNAGGELDDAELEALAALFLSLRLRPGAPIPVRQWWNRAAIYLAQNAPEYFRPEMMA